MNTPIYDFVTRYIENNASRLHMPGHKGRGALGCEARDITEIPGADALYEAEGIIAESERNASLHFGSGATFYGAEGSSQCIRAMLYLAMVHRKSSNARPVALAARNAHKSLLYAAALCDFDVAWLWPEGNASSLCACPVTPTGLQKRLDEMDEAPFCVFITSPDYLGGMQDIRALSAVCRQYDIPLLVDNAHGAYLKFLPEPMHPLDLGADICCDSAHKTLPVLTGGAYLHLAPSVKHWAGDARDAMALFGSTSPSYLILQSLDLCNARLAGDYPARLKAAAERLAALKQRLSLRGLNVCATEPMKLTLAGNAVNLTEHRGNGGALSPASRVLPHCGGEAWLPKAPHHNGELSPKATEGHPVTKVDSVVLAGDGLSIAEALRRGGVECEYADRDYAVLMFSPENTDEDYRKVEAALSHAAFDNTSPAPLMLPRPPRAMTLRQAIFAPSETIPTAEAEGRICAAPTVACPPAVPVAVSGEVITAEVAEMLARYGIESVRVVSL